MGKGDENKQLTVADTNQIVDEKGAEPEVNNQICTDNSSQDKLDLETAKVAFEVAKMTYQNEYNRFDSIDVKFYYIFVIAGGLLAALGFIFGKDEGSPIYLVIMFILKFAIIGALGTTLIITMLGLKTVQGIKRPECSDVSNKTFIGKEDVDAHYTLVNSFGMYIDINSDILKEKCDKFDLACKILIGAFLAIGLKLVIDMIVSLASHIAK